METPDCRCATCLIARIVKLIKENPKIIQREIATAVGIGVARVKRWEKEKRIPPVYRLTAKERSDRQRRVNTGWVSEDFRMSNR